MSKNLQKIMVESLSEGGLLSLVDNSFSTKQVLLGLGFSAKGQYIALVKEFLDFNEIDTSHFTPTGKPKISKIEKTCICCGTIFRTEARKEREQVVCSRSCSNTYFRSGTNNGNFISGTTTYREKALKKYGAICNRCGYSDNIAAIVVHHIDHNRENSADSNLEVLCANCHAIHHYQEL